MGLSACAEWILNFVQETAGVSTDPQGSWSTKLILFLSFLVCEGKTGPSEKLKKKNCFGYDCLHELYRSGTFVQEIAGVSTDPQGSQPSTFCSWVSWSVKQRLVFQNNWIEEEEFDLSIRLSACAECIWNYVREVVGVSTDAQGSWSSKHIVLLSFSVFVAMTCPP